ncbi:MAG: hypothetical protein ACREQD_09635, partial [Candidatus Binataceae bacterium]
MRTTLPELDRQTRATARRRIFGALAHLDEAHPWLVLFAAGALAILSVIYARARLEFRTGQDDLVSADSRASRDYIRYEREFPDLDGLIVVVRTQPSLTQAERFADRLAERLSRDRVNVKRVFYRIDPAQIGNRALLYLD